MDERAGRGREERREDEDRPEDERGVADGGVDSEREVEPACFGVPAGSQYDREEGQQADERDDAADRGRDEHREAEEGSEEEEREGVRLGLHRC